jgi:uncharacterized membrane protein
VLTRVFVPESKAPTARRFDPVGQALGIAFLAGVTYAIIEAPRVGWLSGQTIAVFAAAAAARARSAHARWAVGKVSVATGIVYLAGAASLWTLAAAILGGEQLVAQASVTSSVHDHFQQGQVAVSISWVLVGLALVVVSLGGDRRAIRVGGIALLFVALGKLFLYDLAFLSAMARAVSFIATGSVLLVAALLLQRFAPQVKAALGEDQPPGVTG